MVNFIIVRQYVRPDQSWLLTTQNIDFHLHSGSIILLIGKILVTNGRNTMHTITMTH